MNFESGTPSYYGPTPSAFAVTGVTFEGQPFEGTSFAIDAVTGALSITNTSALAIGVYKISVECTAGGRKYKFADAIEVNMLAATPESITPSKSEVELLYGDADNANMAIQLSLVGTSVSITRYSLVQDSGKEFFAINAAGVISFNSAFQGDVPPGVYPITVKVTTAAGTATYTNVVVIKIVSAPLELSYTPAEGKMEVGTAYTSPVPVLKGSVDQLVYTVAQVTPATPYISVNAADGRVTVAENSVFAIGDTFVVDVTATNKYGTKTFASAYTISVIDFINPVSSFSYAATESVQGGAFSVSRDASFVGDEVTFEFVGLAAGLQGKLELDAATGTVSAVKGNTIAIGTYNITVRATNIKNSVDAVLILTVTANPYLFTKIVYGNNLDLAPAENYANQFRFNSQADMTAASLTPTTDIPAGITATWTVSSKHQMSGTTIDAATGTLSLAGYSAGNGGMILVTATTGAGTAGETSITVPVFFNFPTTVGGLMITYTPFVFKVNPRTGGSSVAATVTGTVSNLYLDYRRTFNYYNLGGPDSHVSGPPTSTTANTFMKQLWTAFYTGIGSSTVNTGAKKPVSYYDTSNGFNNTANLASLLLYVNPTASYSVKVNPNKFVDDMGNYANGVFIGQMTYGDGSLVDTNRQFPLFIWFDEKF